MPLGLGRSLLTRYEAPAAAGASAYAYFSNRTATSTDVAGFQVIKPTGQALGLSNGNALTVIFWIRAKPAEITSSLRTVTYRDTADQGGGQGWIGNGSASSYGIFFNFYNGSTNLLFGSTKTGSTYGDSQTAWQNGFLDGSWHCVKFTINGANGSQRYVYIDGEDHSSGFATNSSVATNTISNTKLNQVNVIGIGHQPYNDTYGGYAGVIHLDNPGVDFGPIWVYDSFINLADATTRGYYYNASNTDGFVDPGTDGTDGGATQPEFFLRHNGTTLENGGSITTGITVFKAVYGTGTFDNNTRTWSSPSSGDITVIADTDGPGSGGTR